MAYSFHSICHYIVHRAHESIKRIQSDLKWPWVIQLCKCWWCDRSEAFGCANLAEIVIVQLAQNRFQLFKSIQQPNIKEERIELKHHNHQKKRSTCYIMRCQSNRNAVPEHSLQAITYRTHRNNMLVDRFIVTRQQPKSLFISKSVISALHHFLLFAYVKSISSHIFFFLSRSCQVRVSSEWKKIM